MQWLFLLSTGLVGASVLTSYGMVLGNIGNIFPLENVDSYSYFTSPYWLGANSESIRALVVLQILAAFGYVVWVLWLTSTNTVITYGVLQSPFIRFVLIQSFLLSSLAWPFTAYYFMRQQTLMRSIIACVPLWGAALSVIVLIGGTFEAKAPAVPTLGILALGTVVVLADGVGWCALALYPTIHSRNDTTLGA